MALLDLPDGVVERIATFLELPDVCRLARASRRTSAIVRASTAVWRGLTREHLGRQAGVVLGDFERQQRSAEEWKSALRGVKGVRCTLEERVPGEHEEWWSPRYLQRGTLLDDGRQALLLGGAEGQACHEDAWLVDLSGMGPARRVDAEAPQGDRPSRRCSLGVAKVTCRRSGRRVVAVFGGSRGFFEGFTNALWLLEIEASEGKGRWIAPREESERPSARWGHSLVELPDGRALLFGGSSTRGCFNDAHILEVREEEGGELAAAWRHVALSDQSPVPAPRGGHAAAAVGERVMVQGGTTRSRRVFEDLWELDLSQEPAAWRRISSGGPGPRVGHSLVAIGRFLVVIGGRAPRRGTSSPEDVQVDCQDQGVAQGLTVFRGGIAVLDLVAGRWRLYGSGQASSPATHRRTGHFATACPGGLLVAGGLTSRGSFTNSLLKVRLV